jgi:signal transduction histidine kinase
MVNLLSNAIRYSPENSRITIELRKRNEEVLFSVRDSGKGIDSKYKSRIFEKFYQVPNSDSSSTGTGLGLAISKDFIIAQGGEIWMESELNQGSKFSFLLKL